MRNRRAARRTGASLLCVLTVGLLLGCSSNPTASTPRTSRPSASPQGSGLVVVHGRVLMGGGPAGEVRPLRRGRVTFDGPVTAHTRVDHRGRFSLSLPTGRYRATALSRDYQEGRYPCEAKHPVRVTHGEPVRPRIDCQVR